MAGSRQGAAPAASPKPSSSFLRAGELPKLLDPAERAALSATAALTRTGILGDAEYCDTVAEWGNEVSSNSPPWSAITGLEERRHSPGDRIHP
jgi:hypothetical protein